MSLFRKEVVHDFLNDKSDELNLFAAQAEDAVDLITNTIARLKHVNENINRTTAEIETYMHELDAVRNKLSCNHKHNEALIGNFSKLLNIDTNN